MTVSRQRVTSTQKLNRIASDGETGNYEKKKIQIAKRSPNRHTTNTTHAILFTY